MVRRAHHGGADCSHAVGAFSRNSLFRKAWTPWHAFCNGPRVSTSFRAIRS